MNKENCQVLIGRRRYDDSWVISIHRSVEGAEATKRHSETEAKFNDDIDVIFFIREYPLED